MVRLETMQAAQFAYFQSVGGEEPIARAWSDLAEWVCEHGVDWQSRFIAGYDSPHPAWAQPPHGYVALCEVRAGEEAPDGKFEGVFVKKYNTDGKWATVEVPVAQMQKAWDTLFAWQKDNSEGGVHYEFDTDARQYFEQHICPSKEPDMKDAGVVFKIWMPVREAKA